VQQHMTALGWISAAYVVAFGLMISGVAVVDVFLIQCGRASITDRMRSLAAIYPVGAPVVSTALITGAVVLLLGLVLGHLWLS